MLLLIKSTGRERPGRGSWATPLLTCVCREQHQPAGAVMVMWAEGPSGAALSSRPLLPPEKVTVWVRAYGLRLQGQIQAPLLSTHSARLDVHTACGGFPSATGFSICDSLEYYGSLTQNTYYLSLYRHL